MTKGQKAVIRLARVMVQSAFGRKVKISKRKHLSLQKEASKALLDKLSTEDIEQRISRFRALSFASMSYDEVRAAVDDVISHGLSKHMKIAVLPQRVMDIKTGAILYRARKYDKLRHINDCWSPPPDKVRANRLNRDGQPLFYASCEDQHVVLREVDAQPDEAVSLIVYRAKEPIRIVPVGIYPHFTDYTPEQSEKLKLFTNFFREELTRPVTKENDYLYQISQATADLLKTGPEQDGWLYPSIKAGHDLYNVCLFPNRARQKLEIVGVVATTVLTCTDIHLRTRNHFWGRVHEDGESLQYGFFVPEEHGKHLHGEVMPDNNNNESRQQIERLRSVPGSWPHLYWTEMEKLRQKKLAGFSAEHEPAPAPHLRA